MRRRWLGEARPRKQGAVQTQRSRKVVLFLPRYAGKVFGPPLGLLSLAGSLRVAGFEPRIIDAAITPDYHARIATEIANCLCFGVSLLTGPMILDAIDIARMVRQVRPDLPIVFGGWHPSLESAQTLREDYVDIVVRHQGDITLVELLKRLQTRSSLALLPGCWFKCGGRIVQNSERPALPLPDLAPPAYDLVDFAAYETAMGERQLPFATSIGCPYACNYCTDMVFYQRRFNALGVERVVADMTSLASRYRITDIALVDSNFLVDVPRAVAIANRILNSGTKFRWNFQASTNLLCRMSQDDVDLLRDSGVHHIGFGTESASLDVLRYMNKSHQNISEMFETAGKCHQAGIRVTFNLIFGFPGELPRHRGETLRTMGEIAARYPNVIFSPNLFTPYPGIPIWPELRERGLQEPANLEAWAQVHLGANNLPWLSGASLRTLERSIRYVLLHNRLRRVGNGLRWRRSLLKPVLAVLEWRIRNSRFRAPIELALANVRRRLVVRRSLLTGQPLSNRFARPIH